MERLGCLPAFPFFSNEALHEIGEIVSELPRLHELLGHIVNGLTDADGSAFGHAHTVCILYGISQC